MKITIHAIRRAFKELWRGLKWQYARCLFLVFGIPIFTGEALADQPTLGPFEIPKPKELTIPVSGEAFDVVEALNGAYSDREHCTQVPGGLWVEVDGTGDCIRHYPHGFSVGENARALVYFSGDVMLRTAKGVRYIGRSYLDRSPASIDLEMAEWSQEATVPAIFLARPGTYGSSGDHNQRRHLREIELMNRALDMLKHKYGISSFIMMGHSAGGQIAAALLNKRQDVEAAVLTSPLVSVKQVAAYWENRREIPGRFLYDADAFYDPVDEIGEIAKNPLPQIYVVSDPEDRSVPFFSQLYYVRRLRAAGFQPRHIYAHAPGPARHLLAMHGKRAAALLARGQSVSQIRKALLELDLRRYE
ncbi:Alpha/beta hydrolase family protein [compost metagenome]